MYGSHHTSRRWTPQIEISGPNVGTTLPEEFIVDPYLSAITVDPFDPSAVVVIPSGRFLGIGSQATVFNGTSYQMGILDTGKPRLTLHNGKNTKPVGMSVNQMYREANDFMTDSNNVKVRKGFLAEVPYILSVNGAHGTPKTGDRVTGYWGSTTSTSPTNLHMGKPVKWVAKNTYAVNAIAASAVFLPAATYPGITPTSVAAFTASGDVLLSVSTAFAWNTDVSQWQATFTGLGSAVVRELWYAYGQDADQIAGEVVRVRNLNDMNGTENFMKWVELNPGDYVNFPPAMQRAAVTSVSLSPTDYVESGETPSTVVSGRQYRVANYPMSVHHPVIVYIQGTVVAEDGSSTTYSGSVSSFANWYALPTNALTDQRRYFIGKYHTVNWRTGIIDIGTNVTVTAIRVVYSYITDPRLGAVLWGAGIIGLTDGGNITPSTSSGGVTITPAKTAGIPAHLNYVDVVGAMRVFVH
jgi:hypothetical protein